MAFIRRSAFLSLEICKGINKSTDKGDLFDTDCLDFQKYLPKSEKKPNIHGRSSGIQ